MKKAPQMRGFFLMELKSGVFVLPRSKDHAFGGGWLLARGDDAAGGYPLTAGQVVHLGAC